MRRWLSCAVLCVLSSLSVGYARTLTPCDAAEQSVQPTILRGWVVDSSRGAIPGAHVTATSDRSGLSASATTNGQGDFELALIPDVYTVRVNAVAFVERVRR